MHEVQFDSLQTGSSGRVGDSPLVVVLKEGVRFTSSVSPYPCAFAPEPPSDKPGKRILGYVASLTREYVELTPDAITESGRPSDLGGYRVYKEAIHSIQVHPEH